MGRFDLHMHSLHSDGRLPPEELGEKCKQAGLAGAALTDHDSVDGLETFLATEGIIAIPGVELTSQYQGRELHILGYCIDWRHPALRRALAQVVTARNERAREIVERLQKAGIPLEWEEVAKGGGGFVGRVHIYRAMKIKRIIGEDPEKAAFNHYLGPGGLAYVPHREFPTLEMIDLVKQAGGHPVLAHPGRLDEFHGLIGELCAAGLEGIEVFYPAHTPEMVAVLSTLARKYDLFMTGGSDYHGWENETSPGIATVERRYIEELLADLNEKQSKGKTD
ncbi:MAG: PHP domain-containing protein [Firmicutes bacterium]|jgi:predicted metal-dependent phosphoesterase TrpH|nr:PHP domain-containing protein [Bacillota bacterium]